MPGKEAAITNAGYPQLEWAHSRIPVPIAVPVAFTLSIRAALVTLGAQMLGHLQLHQRLGHDAYTFTKCVQIRLGVRLAQQLGECHAKVVGHRLVLLLGLLQLSR